MARPRRDTRATEQQDAPESPEAPREEQPADGGASEMSYRQAQSALDLTISQLQSGDLDVEAMASLYRRAEAYADRCEALLEEVEQVVMQWDPAQPDQPPSPFPP
ncbi:MAG: exodeoxyribonuclease VII small subunit [Cyanobium sp.]